MKLCECGCGQPTKLALKNDASRNHIAGQPMRFVKNHHSKKFGIEHPNWKGGRIKQPHGYVTDKCYSHPRMMGSYQVYEHILIAERALGRYLPDGAQVHHVNGKKDDNRPENLVICENAAYHRLLHLRQRAYEATGDPTKRRCSFCKQWDDLSNMTIVKTRPGVSYHKRCIPKKAKVQGL